MRVIAIHNSNDNQNAIPSSQISSPLSHYVSMSDQELMSSLQEGQQDALKELIKRYQTKAVWIAYRMLGNYEDARDISQEAFIRIFRSATCFDTNSSFYTWFYRIVSNLCIDFLRKNRHSAKSIPLDESSSNTLPLTDTQEADSVQIKEWHEQIQVIFGKLPAQYRLILILRDVLELNCADIENILSANHNTIRWRLFRARQLFRDLWEKEGFTDPLQP